MRITGRTGGAYSVVESGNCRSYQMGRACLILLTRPAGFVVVSNEDSSRLLKLGNLTANFFFGVNPPDILFDLASNAWVGLTFEVLQEHSEFVQQMCHRLNTRMIRFKTIQSPEDVELYGSELRSTYCLEIIWSQYDKLGLAPAQLSEVVWLFDNQPTALLHETASGIAIFDFDTLLADGGFRDLHLPEYFLTENGGPGDSVFRSFPPLK
jgi:hypothetical protein